ncbi:hypothetical protein GTO91_01275 [Heliobacterium undosum]|uniref:DUF4405 domain-containing protein n=1 Tax=Heliomicrobium undosum TaxID=121734 RepID=A0A845KXL7_9FIRM|nr:hypothetical protein [Heliomicrobium undosum]MZP28352.1 hypothetical protein [Heliomicrobium undosum]
MSENRSVPVKARVKGLISVVLTVAAIAVAVTGVSLMGGDHGERRDPSRRPAVESATSRENATPRENTTFRESNTTRENGATREAVDSKRLPPDAARSELPIKGIHEAVGLALIPLVLIHFILNAKTLVSELGFRNKPNEKE